MLRINLAELIKAIRLWIKKGEFCDFRGSGEICFRITIAAGLLACKQGAADIYKTYGPNGEIVFTRDPPKPLIYSKPPPTRLGASRNKSEEIPLTRHGGVYSLKATLNESITVDAVLDSGAADVSINSEVYAALKNSGTIKSSDRLHTGIYVLADGRKVASERFFLRSIKIGDRTIPLVKCSVSKSAAGSILIGQSALEKLGKYSIDYSKPALLIE